MADSFLGRWSQRKQAVREGKALDEPETVVKPSPAPAVAPPQVARAEEPDTALAAQAPAAPPPSMADVKELTPQSDFAPFVGRDVAPEVRNAAMKKLFTDPHYNVMDRLDIYIDDYSKPDPLPASMLRQMASAKFLKLFEEEAKNETEDLVRDDANTPIDHSVAQSMQPPLTGTDHLTDNTPQARGIAHDHTDLRLQPNHAAGPQEPGRSTE
ncbi:DUF3306 domain-containing protein [Rhodoferax sp.]|uniref:DUF3306 domain-containing protein n=1 Tax=Rhodoferax sp. TaxID=50421 RepID=UPI002728F645|nr:DUF3306 domain-containing protein [Rhodoferax sp.]MDO9199504.1 DUF3306 domain-containing protein [Rhodoferax sp.]